MLVLNVLLSHFRLHLEVEYCIEIDLDTAVQRIEENLGLYFSEQQ